MGALAANLSERERDDDLGDEKKGGSDILAQCLSLRYGLNPTGIIRSDVGCKSNDWLAQPLPECVERDWLCGFWLMGLNRTHFKI